MVAVVFTRHFSEFTETECDPNTFYEHSQQSDLEIQITKWVNLPLALIILCCSPFVIILPFISGNDVNTNCRKIVSLIVLSDFLSTIANLELSWGKTANERPEYLALCTTATITRSLTQVCSMAWTLVLLCYVLLTLQNYFSWKPTKFFIVCHSVIWPYIILSFLATFQWKYHFVYSDNYLNHNACAANFTFVLTKNNSGCLLPSSKSYFILAFYWSYFLMTILSVLSFAAVSFLAYRTYTRRKRSLLESPTSIERSVAKERSFFIFKTTFRFAITALAYIFCFMPILIGQNILSFYGPFNYKLSVVYGVFGGLVQPLGASINVTVYGYLSSSFRSEMKCLLAKIFPRIQRRKVDLRETINVPHQSDSIQEGSRI